MSHIPDKPVKGCLIDMVDCNTKLDRAKVGRQMPSGACHRVQQKLTKFIGQCFKLSTIKVSKIERTFDGL